MRKWISIIFIIILSLQACNYVPVEDPAVYDRDQEFITALQNKSPQTAWGIVAPATQAQLDQQAFEAVILGDGDIRNIIRLFRDTGISIDTTGGDVKSVYVLPVPLPDGQEQLVRFVSTQRDGVWYIANILIP